MKHLLIILSILLLSSPVIGNSHKGETLYGWGEYPDYVWKEVGEKTLSLYIKVKLRMEFQMVKEY